MTTSTRPRRAVAVSLLLVALATMGACASDTTIEAGGDPGSTATTVATAPRTDGTSASRGSTTRRTSRSPSSSPATIPKPTKTVKPGAGYPTFCQAVADDLNAAPDFNWADFATILAWLQRTSRTAAETAPPPIRSAFSDLNKLYEAVDSPSALNALSSNEDYVALTSRINDWTRTNCGFSPVPNE